MTTIVIKRWQSNRQCRIDLTLIVGSSVDTITFGSNNTNIRLYRSIKVTPAYLV